MGRAARRGRDYERRGITRCLVALHGALRSPRATRQDEHGDCDEPRRRGLRRRPEDGCGAGEGKQSRKRCPDQKAPADEHHAKNDDGVHAREKQGVCQLRDADSFGSGESLGCPPHLPHGRGQIDRCHVPIRKLSEGDSGFIVGSSSSLRSSPASPKKATNSSRRAFASARPSSISCWQKPPSNSR